MVASIRVSIRLMLQNLVPHADLSNEEASKESTQLAGASVAEDCKPRIPCVQEFPHDGTATYAIAPDAGHS